MFEECPSFFAGKGPREPLHVVFHEHLNGRAPDRAGPLNRHVHTTRNRHVRAKRNRRSRRFVSLHYWTFKTAGRQSGFFKLPVPAYSKSLYIGVRTTPGPFMLIRTLKSSLSSRKWMSP